MARSGMATTVLVAVVVFLGLALAAACSSPTARPEGAATPGVSGDFGGPPGPIGVPDAGGDTGYPGSSVESIPTERNPYPEPDEAGADEGTAVEGATDEPTEGAADEPTEESTPTG